jgi:hypothetical protein
LREYYRYRDVSAEYEQRGYGSSRSELAWAYRLREPHHPQGKVSSVPAITVARSDTASASKFIRDRNALDV